MLEPLYSPITFKSMVTSQKIATKTLSNNSAEWTKQIIEYFFDRYPQAMNQPVFVQKYYLMNLIHHSLYSP